MTFATVRCVCSALRAEAYYEAQSARKKKEKEAQKRPGAAHSRVARQREGGRRQRVVASAPVQAASWSTSDMRRSFVPPDPNASDRRERATTGLDTT